MALITTTASDELKEALQKECRFVKIAVDGEKLTVMETKECKDSLENDWEMLDEMLHDKEPAYILALAAPSGEASSAWLLIQWIPDNAPIKQKMIYASTRASLVKELGGGNVITDSMQANSRDDVTLEAYKAHRQQKESPTKVLTESEQVAQQVREEELHTRLAGTNTKSHTASLSLGMTKDAEDAVRDFSSFAALKVDLQTEMIDIVRAEAVTDFASFQSAIPDGKPAFCFYRYNDAVIFVYVCPPSAKIREKMLFSASKGPLLRAAEEFGLKPVAKYEVDDMKELDLARIDEDVKPAESTKLAPAPKLTFKKPSAPGRRPTPSNS